MSIKDKLQIILITYNRSKYVKKTFEQLFFDGSPIADCELIVQDNNSTDDTKEVVEEFAKSHPNVKYTKNRYNIGISGNIAKATEIADKEYVWIIGDDDIYDFSSWQEVEDAINNGEKIICLAKYTIPKGYENNYAYQLFQLTFITGGIYSTSLFDDTTIRNVFDNIYTLFPHILPVISLINKGGKIYVTKKAVADNGLHFEAKDTAYTRGIDKVSELSPRTLHMNWITGYCNAINLLKDKKLIGECIDRAISYPDIYPTLNGFYKYLLSLEDVYNNYFYEIFPLLAKKTQENYLNSKSELETWKNRVSRTGYNMDLKEVAWLLLYKLKKAFMRRIKND